MKITGKTIEKLEKDKSNGKCRKWRLWVTTELGRRSRRLSGTYTQAQEALEEFAEELEGTIPNGETFRSYAESWKAWRAASGELDVQTVENDRTHVKTLCRVLGDCSMDAITPEVVKAALLDLRNGNNASGKTLGGTYMNNLYTVLNSIMQTAADDGRIASNPCAKIKAPRPDTAERHALTTSEMDTVFENVAPLAMMGDGRGMLVLLMLDAGLRPQEAIALEPQDVDIECKKIHVRQAMKEKTGDIGKTKRPASVRTLPMTDRLVDACRAYSEHRVGGRCFCENTRDGSPLRAQNVLRWWKLHRVEFGAGNIVPYELRHSNLTKMARFMSPFDLKDWAGWNSIEPAKVYVHSDQNALEAAVMRSQIGIVGGLHAPETHHKAKQVSA